jgi:hypothetical protein
MDLEAQIRAADPARDLAIPPTGPAGARRAQRRAARSRYRGRRLVLGASATAAAAVALSIFVIAGSLPVAPTSAAAAVLAKAGRDAANEPTITLANGQYFYSAVRTNAGGYYTFGYGGYGERAYVTQEQTVQVWEAADGSDREVVTYDGPQLFATPASAEAWDVAGRPSIVPPTNLPYSSSAPLGQEEVFGGPGVLPPPDDLSRLPADPASLEQLINSDETGLGEVTSDPTVPVSPAYTFSTAARILAAPSFDSSPALRTALYQVMASVPGIALLGPATDQLGRSGIEIAGPFGGDGYGAAGGDLGVRDELIIDPTDGAVLEMGQIIADPSLESPTFRRYVGDTPGQLFNWTDYLASGVVDSPSATPPSEPEDGAMKPLSGASK